MQAHVFLRHISRPTVSPWNSANSGTLCQDPDSVLPHSLKKGVPTGIFDAIPSSMQWTQIHCSTSEDSKEDIELLRCQGSWTRAEPSLLRTLLQKEVDQGWVEKFSGNRAGAEQRWPNRAAIGKLNIVLADGKEPRLVLDRLSATPTPCAKSPNTLHRQLPWMCNAASCVEIVSGTCAAQRWTLRRRINASKSRRKSKARSSLRSKHNCITIQSAISAYASLRIGGPELVACTPTFCTACCKLSGAAHGSMWMIYYCLLLFCSADHAAGACVTIALLSIVNAPISWKKARVGQTATWCGWTFNFALETVHLREPKLQKLRDQLSRIACSKKISRKQLEAALGLLMWATN